MIYEVCEMKNNYKMTMYACFIGYIVQAVVNSFVPLLFDLSDGVSYSTDTNYAVNHGEFRDSISG